MKIKINIKVKKKIYEIIIYIMKKHKNNNDVLPLHITYKPYSYQIDIIMMEEYKNKKFILAIEEMTSRKVFLYILKNKSINEIIKKYKTFIKNNIINHIEGDMEFGRSNEFKKINDDNKISYFYFNVKNEHIYKTGGDVLGLIDRFTRTFKEMMTLKLDEENSNDWTKFYKEIEKIYNEKLHSSTNYKPNSLFENENEIQKIINEKKI